MTRISKVKLLMSKQARLERLYKHAKYNEDTGLLQLAFSSPANAPEELIGALNDLFPEDS